MKKDYLITLVLLFLTTSLLSNNPKDQNNLFDTTIFWQITTLAVALFSLIFNHLVKKSLEGKIDRAKQAYELKFEKELQQIAKEKEEILNATFEKTDTELTLLKTKKIYLWGEQDFTTIKRILRRVGFNMENVYETAKKAENGFDILLINNEHATITVAKLIQVVDNLPDNVLAFYYNNNRTFYPTNTLKEMDAKSGRNLQEKVNFATNPAQIYGNLLNTLKYHQRSFGTKSK